MEQFIIAIGRQAGSGGREIGMRLARRLGVPCYGRQELMQIAKGTPDYEEVKSFYEEQPVDSLLYAIATNSIEKGMGHIPLPAHPAAVRKDLLCADRPLRRIYLPRDPHAVSIFLHADPENPCQADDAGLRPAAEKSHGAK